MAIRSDITPEICRKLVRYEAASGKLFWRERERDIFATQRAFNSWNTKHAGREAFLQPNAEGYLRGVMLWCTFRAQRIVWAVHYGKWPDGDIDHIDGDVQNNRIDNLRDVPRAENNRNLSRRSTNRSGVTGVRIDLNTGKWRAMIKAEGKNRHLGCFTTRSAAIAARKDAERKYGFAAGHGRRKLAVNRPAVIG